VAHEVENELGAKSQCCCRGQRYSEERTQSFYEKAVKSFTQLVIDEPRSPEVTSEKVGGAMLGVAADRQVSHFLGNYFWKSP